MFVNKKHKYNILPKKDNFIQRLSKRYTVIFKQKENPLKSSLSHFYLNLRSNYKFYQKVLSLVSSYLYLVWIFLAHCGSLSGSFIKSKIDSLLLVSI